MNHREALLLKMQLLKFLCTISLYILMRSMWVLGYAFCGFKIGSVREGGGSEGRLEGHIWFIT